MNYIIDLDPKDDFAFTKQVTVDDVAFMISFRWFQKIGRWNMCFRDLAGKPLSAPIMVSPGGEVFFDRRDPKLPPGRFGFSGPDPYNRKDLGNLVQLRYISVSE